MNSNNNNTDKENIQNKQRNAQSNSHHPMPIMLTCHDSPLSVEPSMMAHGIKYPVLFGQVGSAHPAASNPGFW